MNRSEHVAVVDWMRKTARPAVGQYTRGYVLMDSPSLASVPDGLRVGSVLGIDLRRDASLADNKYSYRNAAGTVLASN